MTCSQSKWIYEPQSIKKVETKLWQIQQNLQAALRNIKLKQQWSNSLVEKETIKKLKEKDYINPPSDKGTESWVKECELNRTSALEHHNNSNTSSRFPV